MIDTMSSAGFLGLLAVNIVAACGMNLVYITGQLNLGQAGFLAVGAYAAAVVGTDLGAPLVVQLLVAAVAAGVVALPVALGANRLQGIYLIMGTLAAGELIRLVIAESPGLGAAQGFDVAGPSLGLAPILVTTALVLGGSAALMASRFGVKMRSIFDDAQAAQALGVATDRIKLIAVVVSAAVVGVAGGLLAKLLLTIQPDDFDIVRSFGIALYSLIGGVHSLIGAVVGAVVVTTTTSGLTATSARGLVEIISDWRHVLLGVVVLLVMARRPEGIVSRTASLRLLDAVKLRRRWPDAQRPEAATSYGSESRLSALHLRGVSFRYDGVIALDDVSLELAPGEILGLIGGNGAGKTTLIDVVSGRLKRHDGTITLGDAAVDDLPAHVRAGLGIVRTFQTVRTFEHLTIGESMTLAVHDRQQAINELAGVGLAEWADELPAALSQAERRRLEIVRAAASRPAVLMLDEPSAGMNEGERSELAELIRQIRDRGSSVLLVDHNLDVALGVADRVAVLDSGRLIATGTPNEVVADARVRSAYLGEGFEHEGDE